MLAATMGAAAVAAGPQPDEVAPGQFGRSGAWITDQHGRVMVMHGFNIVRKTAPYDPQGFGERDAAFLAEQGFNLARIALIWAGVEPRPGIYDDDYIGRIAALNQLLARHGIHTLIDFHQDSWGEGYHAPPPGDGAPAWARLGETPDQAFQAFWQDQPAADGTGIQTHFIDAWKHVVKILDAGAQSRNIVGYDPLNEPYPGSAYPPPCADFSPCAAFERGPLADFYRRTIAALRGLGDQHLILVEGIAQNATAAPELPAFDDPRTAFNWHYYCPLAPLDADPARTEFVHTCRERDAQALRRMDGYTRRLGLPWLVSEFGGSDDTAETIRLVDQLDQRFLSWTYWMYYTAPGEPGSAPRQGLLIDERHAGAGDNAKPPKLDALAVPYAQAIAGQPLATSYDRSSRVYTLSFAPRQLPAPTEVFVPERAYPAGYRIEVEGATVATRPQSRRLSLTAAPSVGKVFLRISPADGASP